MQMFASSVALALVAGVAGHGSMVIPVPRSSHNQSYDDRNKCGSKDPYSKGDPNIGAGEYCGMGCIGDACLYYQIGCFAGCPTCSLRGKDLYPVPSDMAAADNCKPITPTLGGGDPQHEYELRTNNRDGLSKRGDWTSVNPWRAPGTAGRGNPEFSPCGLNSGAKAGEPLPVATGDDIPQGGSGVQLPKTNNGPTWTRGAVVEASWAIYANHGGGYSYRLCKKAADGSPVTEACFQQIPLDFVGNTTKIVYSNNAKAPFTIPAVTTNVGTYPAGSMWRKNPIPMCNCDLGYYCGKHEADAAVASSNLEHGPVDAKTMFIPYSKSNFRPGQTSTVCPTGVQYPTMWDDGLGGPPYMPGQPADSAHFEYQMVDQLQIPENIPAGDYMLSWRWDCEETPQVWNSCADVTIA